MPQIPLQYSKNRIDRAADCFRDYALQHHQDVDAAVEALGVIYHFRACHSYPLQKATNGLRATVNSIALGEGSVSQRLKRYPTILDKLRRHPNMRLSRMQDIGGCRAVLLDLSDLRRVQDRLVRRKGFVNLADYIETPRQSGYRGVHVILSYDDRKVEIQLRTELMHRWAVSVEEVGARIHHDLKSGEGPPAILSYYERLSEAHALLESNRRVPPDMSAALQEQRREVLALINGQ